MKLKILIEFTTRVSVRSAVCSALVLGQMKFTTSCILSTLFLVALAQIDQELDGSDALKGGKYREVRSLMAQFYSKSRQQMGLDPNVQQMVPVSKALPMSFDDGTEMTANREVLDVLFENDMVLTVEQMQSLVDGLEESRRTKRKIINGNFYRWKSRTIPYRFSVGSENVRNSIRNALRHWEQKTCLRFRENGNGADYITFIQGSGCYSNVGRTGGQQQVSIGQGCESLGIVAHEVGHALGFWHEQSRPDRDQYIWVNTRNMIQGTEGNFAKRSWSDVTNYNVPFDLGSIMHYGPKAFTTDYSKRTIDARDSNYRNTFGQRAKLSFVDIKQVNKAYCSNVCSNSKNCRHGGYPNPNNCNQCLCPEGLGGNCDRASSSRSNCGGDLRASPQWQTLRSPTLRANQECNWRITAPNNGKIVFEVTSVNYPCADTCGSYVEVKHNKNFQQTGPRFCCQRPNSQIKSDQTELLVLHRTDSRGSASYRGFQARYRVEGGGSWTSWTSTARPVTTRRPRPTRPTQAPWSSWGVWSSWSNWGQCSRSCGGCGVKVRRRNCRGQCSGKATDQKFCNAKVCPGGTGGSNGKCKGSLRIPCRFLRWLSADPNKAESFINDMPMSNVQGDPAEHRRSKRQGRRHRKSRERHRKSRERSSGRRSSKSSETEGGWGGGRGTTRATRYCVKTFYYDCRNRNRGRFSSVSFADTIESDQQEQNSQACCSGWIKQGNTCRRRR